jgi:hypothetical protein
VVTILIETYREGFLVGALGSLIVILIFFYFYGKEARQKKEDMSTHKLPEDAPKRPPLRKALRECAIYTCIAFLLFLGIYIWITPIMPYSGKVEKKDHRTRARTILATTYHIYVDGERYTVDKNIHDHVQTGDVIHHPLASQCYYIDGKQQMAAEFAWSTGFWAGVLGIALIVLCFRVLFFGSS